MSYEILGLKRLGRAATIIKAISSGGWWTPEEIAEKTDDDLSDVDGGISDLIDRGFLDRRHLGSNKRGELYAYRLRQSEFDHALSPMAANVT